MSNSFEQWCENQGIVLATTHKDQQYKAWANEYAEQALEAERTQATVDIICAMTRVGIEFAHTDWPKNSGMTVRDVIAFVADRARQMDATEQQNNDS